MGCACGKPSLGTTGTALADSCLCSSGPFTRPEDIGDALIPSLVCVVDRVRDLKTQLGANQYSVHLIHTRWTGGERGVGEEYVFSDVELEPTPSVAAFSGLRSELTSIGIAESGSLMVSEISARYEEDFLLGRINDEPIEEDVNFYWEVQLDPTTPNADVRRRRRFIPSGPPSFEETKFQWSMNLLRASADRTAEGDPRG